MVHGTAVHVLYTSLSQAWVCGEMTGYWVELRTVSTNAKVFLPRLYDYPGNVDLNKCY